MNFTQMVIELLHTKDSEVNRLQKHLISERIFGNAGWVYHRTSDNPEDSSLITKGIKPGTNSAAMYGRGLYCCYDVNQQLKPDMAEKYGSFLLKGKVDLTGFAILDEDVYKTAVQSHLGNFDQVDFSQHLKNIGTNIESINSEKATSDGMTSGIAGDLWQNLKSKGFNGIVFTGAQDGRVAVIWNRRNFIPWAYSQDDGQTWNKLNPNISSIKRKEDKEYDADPERMSAREAIKFLSNKALTEIDSMIVPRQVKIEIDLPNLKEVKQSFRAVGASGVNFPKLEDAGFLTFNSAKYFHAPALRNLHMLNIKSCEELNLPNLEAAMYSISADSAKTVNLPKLTNTQDLHCMNAEYVNIPVLTNIETRKILELRHAKKIIVPKKTVEKFKLPPNCEIVYSDSPLSNFKNWMNSKTQNLFKSK